ncbi:MAG: hypothetical protein M1838_005546 [Thelocarpon superellum]|nr:MAG: hypothetical protein M1838_005546 [Thelocarpon superellum]
MWGEVGQGDYRTSATVSPSSLCGAGMDGAAEQSLPAVYAARMRKHDPDDNNDDEIKLVEQENGYEAASKRKQAKQNQGGRIGKNALTGRGWQFAKALAANGARRVYIIGRRKELLETAAKQSGFEAITPLPGDVTSRESLAQLAAQVEKEVGFVNVVVANAGTSGPTLGALQRTPPPSLSEIRQRLPPTPASDCTNTFAVNNTAVFETVVAFLALLDAGNAKKNVSQKNQFITTSSIGGFHRVPFAGLAYGASKAGATHMMKTLATWLVPYQIRCNVLAPVYPSGLSAPFFAKMENPTAKDTLDATMVPARRMGTQDDMAGATLFLTSRAGAYCNGSVVVTDGGRLSILPSTY